MKNLPSSTIFHTKKALVFCKDLPNELPRFHKMMCDVKEIYVILLLAILNLIFVIALTKFSGGTYG